MTDMSVVTVLKTTTNARAGTVRASTVVKLRSVTSGSRKSRNSSRLSRNGQKKDEGKEEKQTYRMSAVINGEVISHEISKKQYDKFMAVDDYQRQRMMSRSSGRSI
jgi:hypothetical protein